MTFSGFYRLLGGVIFLVLIKYASTGIYLGDSCTLSTRNGNGHCKYFSDCPKALENLHTYQIYPENCEFGNQRPVVCCVEEVEDKIKQKCKEYSENYKNNIAIGPIPDFYIPVREKCYFPEWNFEQGNIAKPNEFPHMAAIGYEGEQRRKTSWLCSGALISNQFVLTAAHCLIDRPHGHPKYIRIGDWDLNSNDDETPPQEFNVAGMYIHPEFKPPSFYNDIGLLKMDRPAKFFPTVRPACLNTNPYIPEEIFILAGWGEESHYSHKKSPLLKEILEFYPPTYCTNVYKNATGTRLKHGILEKTQLCAIPHRKNEKCNIGTGVLQMHSKEEYCMYTILGITSFGRTSIHVDIPDVFTIVAPYSKWIEGIIWP